MLVIPRINKVCALCGGKSYFDKKPHHCFFRSEYRKEDRDEDWNLLWLCKRCHGKIHHYGAKKMDRYCKLIALAKYKGKYREELKKIIKEKFYKI